MRSRSKDRDGRPAPEPPIPTASSIEQDIERVSHRDSTEDPLPKCRVIERLARAVCHHLEHRVLLNRNETIVFPEQAAAVAPVQALPCAFHTAA